MPFFGKAEVIKTHHYVTPSGRTFSPYSTGIPTDAERVETGWDIR